MKFNKINDNSYIIRLEVGEEINEEVISFCKDLDIYSAEIQAIGALGEIELMHYCVETKEYSSKIFHEEMEICSLMGLITSAGIHTHCAVANNKMQCFGGHLKSGIVSATCEIILKVINTKLDRKYDDYTGLKLLNI